MTAFAEDPRDTVAHEPAPPLEHGGNWSPCHIVPWTPPTQTAQWRAVKSELRTRPRSDLFVILGVDEDGLKTLEAQADRLRRHSDWSAYTDEAQSADTWAIRDIERTVRADTQIFRGVKGGDIDPDRVYRVIGERALLNPAEIQARACRQLRGAIGRLDSGASGGLVAKEASGPRKTPAQYVPDGTDDKLLRKLIERANGGVSRQKPITATALGTLANVEESLARRRMSAMGSHNIVVRKSERSGYVFTDDGLAWAQARLPPVVSR